MLSFVQEMTNSKIAVSPVLIVVFMIQMFWCINFIEKDLKITIKYNAGLEKILISKSNNIFNAHKSFN